MGVSGARSPLRVAELLAAAVPGLGERMLEERIRAEWPRAVGQDVARRSQPAALEGGTLVVSVDNSPWLQELTLRAGEVLSTLQSRYGGAIAAIRFTLGQRRAPTGREDA